MRDGNESPHELPEVLSEAGDSTLIDAIVNELATLEAHRSKESVDHGLPLLALEQGHACRECHEDTFRVVEDLYVTFDYPREIEPFVRCVPSELPDPGSEWTSNKRLPDLWRTFLVRSGMQTVSAPDGDVIPSP